MAANKSAGAARPLSARCAGETTRPALAKQETKAFSRFDHIMEKTSMLSHTTAAPVIGGLSGLVEDNRFPSGTN
jgi:hypothetical protein